MLAGVSFDFVLGVALHFADQHKCCDHFGSIAGYINWNIKTTRNVVFFGDSWTMAALAAQTVLLYFLISRMYASEKVYARLSLDTKP